LLTLGTPEHHSPIIFGAGKNTSYFTIPHKCWAFFGVELRLRND